MAEYGREQRSQLSRVIAYNGGRSKQLKGFVDNNTRTVARTKIIDYIQRLPNVDVVQKFEVPKNYDKHVKGEIKNEKYTGGHSQPLMADTWGADLNIAGTQSNEKAYKASWNLKSKKAKPKDSTFYPDLWSYKKIEDQIKSTILMGGKNYAESNSGIIIAKSGDTAYPVL